MTETARPALPALLGLTVRWSLRELDRSATEVATELENYVAEASYAKFSGFSGLRFKTWKTVPGEWFEGSYVFSSDAARRSFQETFAPGAGQTPISVMLGRDPESIEAFRVVAVAEGWEGFAVGSRYDQVTEDGAPTAR